MKNNNIKTNFAIGGVILLIILVMIFSGKIIENNDKTTYQIKQGVFGKITCRMKPGPYFQNFGEIETWNKANSLFYTADKDTSDDVDDNNSIRVRFNQGGLAHISSTMRVTMPVDKEQAKNLVVVDGYTNFKALEEKLLRPTVRKCQKRAASLMSAIESSKERRSEYEGFVIDQLENGYYVLADDRREVLDDVTGEKVWKTFKIVKQVKDKNVYESSPLVGRGIKIDNYEIKSFGYEKKVTTQINEQRDMKMKIQTQKAQSALAEQDTLTVKATKEKELIEKEYSEKIVTAQDTEIAERDKKLKLIEADKRIALQQKAKEVALVKANQKNEVATVNLKTDIINAKAKKITADADAYAKKAIMVADNALDKKLKADIEINRLWSNAHAKRAVPTTVFGASGGKGSYGDSDAKTFMKIMTANAAQTMNYDRSAKARK